MGHTSLWPARLATLNDCERRTLRCHRLGITRPCDIARVIGFSPTSVVLALDNLRACSLVRDAPRYVRDEPDPTAEEQAEIEARLERVRRVRIACRRQYADGIPPHVLDQVLPPIDCARTRSRRRA